MRTKTQEMKSAKIMEALKVGKDGCFKNPSLAKPLKVVFDDTVSTRVIIDGLSSHLSINTRKALIEVIIFDVYAAIASHIIPAKEKKDADKWLSAHHSDLPMGLKYRCSFQMACDKYAIEQTGYIGPTDTIIPFVTMSDVANGIYSENLIEMELKNMNTLVLIRREYAMEIIANLRKEKNNGKKKFSAKELKRMDKNFNALASDVGYGEPKPKTKPNPLVRSCRILGLKVEPCFTFEQCCDTIIKAYHGGDLAPSMNSAIEDFLIPYYTKYKKEFLMSKRDPIREIVQRLFRNAVAGKSITESDIQRTLGEINGVGSMGLHPELRSWNEMTPEEREEITRRRVSV